MVAIALSSMGFLIYPLVEVHLPWKSGPLGPRSRSLLEQEVHILQVGVLVLGVISYFYQLTARLLCFPH